MEKFQITRSGQADSFCKIFVILCSLKNIYSPIDQTAEKESGTLRGQQHYVLKSLLIDFFTGTPTRQILT
jgi:hypothetical protein